MTTTYELQALRKAAVAADRRTNDYSMTGPADGPHPHLAVALSRGDGEASAVKGRVAAALKAECGYDHFLTARRLNGKRLALRWKITARCATRPVASRADVDLLPGVDGILSPVDTEAAEQAELADVEEAAEAAARFYAAELERKQR